MTKSARHKRIWLHGLQSMSSGSISNGFSCVDPSKMIFSAHWNPQELHYLLYHFSDPAICVICPWSVLLSAEGNLSFQNNASQTEAIPFSAPELLHRQNKNQRIGLTKVRYTTKKILIRPCEGKVVGFHAAYQVSTVKIGF